MGRRKKNMLRRAVPLKALKQTSTDDKNITGHIDTDYEKVKQHVSASDLKHRFLHTAGHRRLALFYYANLVDLVLVSDHILRPLQEYAGPFEPDHVAKYAISVPEYRKVGCVEDFGISLADGCVGLLLEGNSEALVMNVMSLDRRSIERSESEDVLIGPHESFSESLGSNVALLRRRLATPNLKVKALEVGRESRTKVAILYIEGIVQEKLVQEAEERIGRIDVDYTLGATMLAGLLEDAPLSLFPQLRLTERPTRVVPALAEGRLAIMADGDPSAIIAPTFAPEYLQAAEDYFERPHIGTFLRFIRLVGLAIALFLPGIWISVVSFHHGVLPPPLYNSIVAGREGVPLPTVLEMIILLFSFDIVIEASTRMPSRIGQALGIVGGLILGQSAVQAGLVSPAIIIVVALTGLSIFAQPSPTFVSPLRILKYPIVFVASVMGLFGVVWLLILMIIQITALRSFGYPFMYPMAPLHPIAEADILMRLPLFWHQRRPNFLAPDNPKRMNVKMPRPPESRDKNDS